MSKSLRTEEDKVMVNGEQVGYESIIYILQDIRLPKMSIHG